MLYNTCNIPYLICLYSHYSTPWMLYNIPKCYMAPPVMPDVRKHLQWCQMLGYVGTGSSTVTGQDTEWSGTSPGSTESSTRLVHLACSACSTIEVSRRLPGGAVAMALMSSVSFGWSTTVGDRIGWTAVSPGWQGWGIVPGTGMQCPEGNPGQGRKSCLLSAAKSCQSPAQSRTLKLI